MSLPIFAELLLQLLVGNVDQMMASRYSQSAVAAIGNGNQLMNVVIIVLNAMSAATTILLSQYLGARDRRKVTEVCNASVVVIGAGSLLATGLLLCCSRGIFRWMRVPGEVLGQTESYTMLVGSFILVQGLYMTLAAILRSHSLLREVMLVSLAMNGINILGNSLLINGAGPVPAMGVVGAAVSTNISKVAGLLFLWVIYRRRVGIPLSPKLLRPYPAAVTRRLLFFALPSGGESLSYQLSQTVIMRMVNLFGTAVIATKVYCSILANVAYVYSIAMAQATQIVTGYLLGEGKVDRIGRRVWSAVGISLAVSLSVTLTLYLNSDAVFGLFTSDPVVLELGRDILMVEFVLEIGRSVNIVMVRCLMAVGDVEMPVISCVASAWVVAIGLGWYLGVHLGWGLVGIWIAMAADEVLRGAAFVLRFLSGAWKRRTCVGASQPVAP